MFVIPASLIRKISRRTALRAINSHGLGHGHGSSMKLRHAHLTRRRTASWPRCSSM